jgi:hypothetical protein
MYESTHISNTNQPTFLHFEVTMDASILYYYSGSKYYTLSLYLTNYGPKKVQK